jgi:hypothetical protein
MKPTVQLVASEMLACDPLPGDSLDFASVPCEIVAAEDKPDPREALDAVKRATIVALVRLGASRRMAAGQVGCAHRTIARTAARNPRFAAELAAAESRADAKSLRLIDRATDQEKYWRAAAWVLERRNPEEFGQRKPKTYTPGHVLKFFDRFLHAVLPRLPPECRDILLDEYDEVFGDITRDPNAAADKKQFANDDAAPVPAPLPPPPPENECPRDEGEARQWLSRLSLHQVGELRRRAEEKPDRPDWNHWRKLVEEAWQRAYAQSEKDYRREVRERREKREARRLGLSENARCAPVHTNGGSQAVLGTNVATRYGPTTCDAARDAPQ